jgi:hypothetical protein
MDSHRTAVLLHKARACIIAADSELSAILAHRPPDFADIDVWVREARRIEVELRDAAAALEALRGEQ